MIVPDGRGAGASWIPYPEKYTAEALANDVDEILKALDITGKAFIVGHDLGAKAATAYSHLHPEKVARLVVSEFRTSRLRIRGIHGPGWLVEQQLALILTVGPRRCDVPVGRSGTAVFTVVLLARYLF